MNALGVGTSGMGETEKTGWWGRGIGSKHIVCTYKNVVMKHILKIRKVGHQWLTAVILATWGGWDQEDHGLKPAWANSSWDPISKITRAKGTGGVAQEVEACFASVKPWVQSPVPPPKKDREKRWEEGRGIRKSNKGDKCNQSTI
jgi:hypothetical protein